MKTIVSDLDGTLLNSYGEVDSFTKEVLNTSPIHRLLRQDVVTRQLFLC